MIITAYQTRIQLAILDHNAQLDHSPKLHSESHAYQYHRRYRKQTCNWDVVQVMQAKDYKYIPELLKEIFLQWESSSSNMKSRATASQDNPPYEYSANYSTCTTSWHSYNFQQKAI